MERVKSNKSNKPMSQALKDAQKRYYEKKQSQYIRTI